MLCKTTKTSGEKIMKSIIRATNVIKKNTLSSIFVVKLQNNGNDIYIRKYIRMIDNRILCVDLIGNDDKMTELKSLENTTELKVWDNMIYGDVFQ